MTEANAYDPPRIPKVSFFPPRLNFRTRTKQDQNITKHFNPSQELQGHLQTSKTFLETGKINFDRIKI